MVVASTCSSTTFRGDESSFSPLTDKSDERVLEIATEIADRTASEAASVDCMGGFPVDGFARLAASGFLSAPLQSEHGGIGLGFDSDRTALLLKVLVQLGRGNLSLGRVFEGHVNALQLIQTFGSSQQVARFAADACAGKIFGVWNAEAADGVKLHPLERGGYRLEGSKTFCSGCGYVERPFVNGVLPDGGWQMCIVPMEEVDISIDASWWQPLGMKASASYKVNFTGVELSEDELIGPPGQYFRQPWLSAGVVRFAAVQLGGAEALFDATRRYLQDLRRTDHPYQQTRLGRMAIALEQGKLWLSGSADQVRSYAPMFGGLPNMARSEQAIASEQLTAYANMTRSTIEQVCMDMIQLSERSVGTLGLLPPYPMERIIRDLTLYLRQPAFDAALADVGKYVLSAHADARELWDR